MADKSGQVNEQKTAAASFIINFYTLSVNLKDQYAKYENLLIELEAKYKNVDMSKLEEPDKNNLLTNMQNLRYFIIMSYVDYKTLFDYFTIQDQKLKEDPNITLSIDKLRSQVIIKRQDALDYVIGINRFLLSSVIKKLLESSQDIINGLYE